MFRVGVNRLRNPAENRVKHTRIENFQVLLAPRFAITLALRQSYKVPGLLGHSLPILNAMCIGQGSFKVSKVYSEVQDLSYSKSLAWQVPSCETHLTSYYSLAIVF